jgi:hypothetical protein
MGTRGEKKGDTSFASNRRVEGVDITLFEAKRCWILDRVDREIDKLIDEATFLSRRGTSY